MSSMQTLTPGETFAAACAQDGVRAQVQYSATITELFPGFGRRPRLAVRALFKVLDAAGPRASYWFETRPSSAPAQAAAKDVHEVKLRPEAAFAFHRGETELKPTTAWLQVPDGLLEHPDSLAQFIDTRLLVRLCTAENQRLTRGGDDDGTAGLLSTPGIVRLPARRDPVSSFLSACEEVENMGGSADGALVHPTDFYRYFVGKEGLLADLASLGVRIARTRMVPVGSVIVGDFLAGASLLDSRRSSIRFAEPPPGTFAQPGVAVCGEIHESLVVHLPTHFFVASLIDR